MSGLRDAAVMHVARDLARSRIKGELNTPNEHYVWFNKTLEHMDEAREKINAMSNLELLDLLEAIKDD